MRVPRNSSPRCLSRTTIRLVASRTFRPTSSRTRPEACSVCSFSEARGVGLVAVAQGTGIQIAGTGLFVNLFASWAWSWRDVRSAHVVPEAGFSQWDLAVRAFSKNRTAVVGAITIVVLYLIALVTPVILFGISASE